MVIRSGNPVYLTKNPPRVQSQSFGAAAFAPTDVAGLAAWYKADSIGQADNTTIASWSSSGGGAAALTQATEANKPLYQTNELNGLPGVQVVDATDVLTNALDAGAQPFTVFAVARAATWVGSMDICGQAAGNWRIGFNADANDARIFAGTVLATTTNLLVANTPYVFTGLFNGVSSALRVNGTLATASGAAGAAAFGASFRVPGLSTPEDDHFIFEVIVYSGDKTANFSTLESYLGSKWGITIT